MGLYAIHRAAVTLAAGADVAAIISASNRRVELVEASLSGNGGTSAAAAYQEVMVGACTAPSGGSPTSLNADKLDPDQGAAASTCAFGHSTPSATFLARVRLGLNAYGGIYRWVARQKGE